VELTREIYWNVGHGAELEESLKPLDITEILVERLTNQTQSL
jgi:hypothetical protein